MTYHSAINHTCGCGADYIPFKAEMTCPNCGVTSLEPLPIVAETLEALADHGYQPPPIYAKISIGDWYIMIATDALANMPRNLGVKAWAQSYAHSVSPAHKKLEKHVREFLLEVLPQAIAAYETHTRKSRQVQ
jgi:hypothetical protein